MSTCEFKNNARSTVADSPLAVGATTLNVATGEGANFPALFPFKLTLFDDSSYPDAGLEIVKCTGRTADALTIVRAQEGTVASEHANGERVAMLITAGHFNDPTTGIVTMLDTIEPFINQSVISGASPTFDGTNFTNVDADTLIVDVKEANVSAVTKGQMCAIVGSSGAKFEVQLCDCDDANLIRVLGLVAADTAQNETGQVVYKGLLTNVDTQIGNANVNPNGETWTAGDLLFVSTTPGGLTNVRPSTGRCIKASRTLKGNSASDTLLAIVNTNSICACAAAGEDICSRMGDNGGVNKHSFKDYDDNEIAALDSNGNLTLIGTADGRDISVDGTKLDTIEISAKDDQSASEVPNTPAGNIAATDVQAAIDELDTEKAPKASPAFTGEVGMSSASPKLTLHNTEHEDTDYGREGELIFKGEQSGGEETTLGKIQVAHDGVADDQKGIMSFKVNDGTDGDAPTTAMTILADGSVGIGTTEPTAALSVVGKIGVNVPDQGVTNFAVQVSSDDISTLAVSRNSLNTGDAAAILFGVTNDDQGYKKAGFIFERLGANGIGALHIANDDTADSSNATIADARMTITSTGNTGIGTTNPQNKLDIEGGLAVGAGYSGTYTAPSNGAIIEGNVGIGTNSPTEKLDVNGDAIRIRTAQTPASAGAAGNQGDIRWDADYVYVCVATNTWKRTAISTW